MEGDLGDRVGPASLPNRPLLNNVLPGTPPSRHNINVGLIRAVCNCLPGGRVEALLPPHTPTDII
jgi:hypothetical protein